MEKNASKVYFTNLRCEAGMNRLDKLEKLVFAAGIEKVDFKDKFVAVKIHFGEPGNMSHLRPEYAKLICDIIKKLGGKPFLADCNTLYAGYRKDALGHLDAANLNGFCPMTTGVQNIIADGIKGTDEREVPVEGGEYVKNAKIGAAFVDADIIVSLTHFKGHVSAGYGGTLKNLGMGCGSRRGKLEMHSAGAPEVDQELCIACGQCAKNCLQKAITFVEKKYSSSGKPEKAAFIDEKKCVGCGFCMAHCAQDAIMSKWDVAKDVLNYKIAEYTKAVIADKPAFHISLAIDISPNCDCEAFNDVAMVPDVGFFASFDPVALDQACVDAVNLQPIMPGSKLDHCCGHEHEHAHGHEHEGHEHSHDIFTMSHPNTRWEAAVEHGEKIGLGTRKYELIEV